VYPPPPPGAIGLELKFGLLAGRSVTSTSFVGRKYNTMVEIDGVRYEREGGAWHVFPVAAGWHLVCVYFCVRPTFLSQPKSARQLQVQVYPNAMARLVYDGGALWPLFGGELKQIG
jgi:hypothetical protein